MIAAEEFIRETEMNSAQISALYQESQRSNRLRVVFNHFFCGTFLVHETNLGVLHEGA